MKKTVCSFSSKQNRKEKNDAHPKLHEAAQTGTKVTPPTKPNQLADGKARY